MLKLTGDFAPLARLVQRLDHPDSVLVSVSKVMAEETLDLIDEGFDEERDPYGKPWAPKQKPDGRKVLHGPSGRLKSGYHRTHANADGYGAAAAVEYADHHQRPRHKRNVRGQFTGGKFGGLKRPRRMQVPDPKKGMPNEWGDRLAEAAMEALRTAYGK